MEEGELLPPSVDDPNKPIHGSRRVRAVNEGGTLTRMYLRDFDPLVVDEPEERGGGNTAPTPMEMVLAALAGCKGVTVHYVARAMRLDYSGVRIDGVTESDIRGARGVPGIKQFFDRVHLTITVLTDESEARMATLKRNVEARCPVANLIKSAGVDLRIDWKAVPASEAESAT